MGYGDTGTGGRLLKPARPGPLSRAPYDTVAVPELVIPYSCSFAAPVVGTFTGVLAATGNPVEAVTPASDLIA